MRRFRFRLDRLLALRQRESEAARQALARTLAAEAAARGVWERLEQRKAADLAELLDRPGGMQAPELAQRRQHLAALVQAAVQASGQLAAAVAATAAQREALARARQRQRTLERLRERRLAEHGQAAGRQEQADLDDWGRRHGHER